MSFFGPLFLVPTKIVRLMWPHQTDYPCHIIPLTGQGDNMTRVNGICPFFDPFIPRFDHLSLVLTHLVVFFDRISPIFDPCIPLFRPQFTLFWLIYVLTNNNQIKTKYKHFFWKFLIFYSLLLIKIFLKLNNWKKNDQI